VTDAVLRSLNAELDELYADSGRPSIAPEYILRALLLQVFFSIRSERLLVEQIALQPVVSLVCWVGHGRCGVESRGVLEEP
jgi:transposase